MSTLTACNATPASETAAGSLARATMSGTWSALPAGPLSARHSALAVAVGHELFLLGGRDTPLCPPTASCVAPTRPALRDAAAYDIATRKWRQLASLPVAASAADSQAVLLNNMIHVLVTHGASAGAHLRYDVSGGAWERLPSPPDHQVQLVAAGDALVAYKATQERGWRPDLIYRPALSEWQALPGDPLQPSFDRAMTWTGQELVLTGPAVVAAPGGESGPSYVRSAALELATGSWRRLPDQTQVISYGTDRSWDGHHVISPYIQSFDGGQVNGFGRTLPTGGLLDTSTGQWASLPAPPKPGAGRYTALSRRWVTTGSGLVFDTSELQWSVLSDHDAAVDQGEAAAWVDDALIVWGGGSPLVATGSAWSADS